MDFMRRSGCPFNRALLSTRQFSANWVRWAHKTFLEQLAYFIAAHPIPRDVHKIRCGRGRHRRVVPFAAWAMKPNLERRHYFLSVIAGAGASAAVLSFN